MVAPDQQQQLKDLGDQWQQFRRHHLHQWRYSSETTKQIMSKYINDQFMSPTNNIAADNTDGKQTGHLVHAHESTAAAVSALMQGSSQLHLLTKTIESSLLASGTIMSSFSDHAKAQLQADLEKSEYFRPLLHSQMASAEAFNAITMARRQQVSTYFRSFAESIPR